MGAPMPRAVLSLRAVAVVCAPLTALLTVLLAMTYALVPHRGRL